MSRRLALRSNTHPYRRPASKTCHRKFKILCRNVKKLVKRVRFVLQDNSCRCLLCVHYGKKEHIDIYIECLKDDLKDFVTETDAYLQLLPCQKTGDLLHYISKLDRVQTITESIKDTIQVAENEHARLSLLWNSSDDE